MTVLTDRIKTLKLSEVEVVAATLWGEGRGENVLSRIAIGCVIRNRMLRRKQTATQVCLAKLQFSCWWVAGGEGNYDCVQSLIEGCATSTDPTWLECKWIAQGILDGVCRDITKSADHYLTTRLLGSVDRPKWVNAMTCTGVVGAHTFYRS